MESNYRLDIEKAVEAIKSKKAKKVCIQLPDGLKPLAGKIYDKLKEKTEAEIYIWAGTCYGACDYPFYLKDYKFDLLIQWGHSKWL